MSDKYSLSRDADTIAKFVGRCMGWEYKYQLYKAGTGEFPRPISKTSKWPAYEAASRIERTLKLDTHASSVPELAALLGVAFTAINTF